MRDERSKRQTFTEYREAVEFFFEKMQYKIFTISIFDEDKTEEMNRFLRGNKVVNVEKQCIASLPHGAFWSFCIHYIGAENKSDRPFGEQKPKVDYKAVLDEAAFAKFSKLREFRKQIADKDAVPAYAVFTDAELAEIAKLSEITEKYMLAIQGIGEKKVAKYGKTLCDNMSEETLAVAPDV
ncbi:MAG: ATP-dependent DNA helicase RecQ [Candidatus Ordinivivax streblomastigis]|uniref:ATP-dependent DNA helicase RecQ n=1 Tax=Candidatus Ordinivivax streblomastigis TaxID=2540710 RepID=A0A5M8P4P5_9BACT|nr:MAG: ATP-dependent DNA helicase RecQ [Candidatus Ordinivivax streblomastigis]